jgi:short-subunit dehydrogenase
MKALITGATSGIGESLARLLASKGVSLILTGRNEPKLQGLKAELSSQVAVQTVTADLQDKIDRERIVQVIREGSIDLLVNNAGFGVYGPAVSKSTAELLDVLELNAAAVLELTIEAAKTMVASNKEGVIMNISSVAAYHLIPNLAVYSATKAFVNNFSETLDYELKPKGVRVLTACPGKVATEFQARASNGRVKLKAGGTVMSQEFAANEIWEQIQSKKSVHIFDWKYRLATICSRFVPKSLAIRLAANSMKHSD